MPKYLLRPRRAEDIRFAREWLVLLAAGIAFVTILAGYKLTGPLDGLIYDWWLQHRSRHASADIVVVEIDNESLEQLGQWPWRRDYHAAALERIAAARARCVLYDVLFSEPTAADAVLAHAMTLVPVYLPLVVESTNGGRAGRAIPPVEELRAFAAGIGHINLEADKDGIVRGVALYEGNAEHMWPQFTLPAYLSMHGASAPVPQARSSDAVSHKPWGPLIRSDRVLIPFFPDLPPYRRVSFIDVLNGRVPAEVFHDKIVLVGATADGLQEHLTTAVSASDGSMTGVEIHASILDGLLAHSFIRSAGAWLTAGVSVIPVLLLFAGFLLLAPCRSIVLLPLLLLVAYVASGVLLAAGIWVTPAPAIIAIVFIYPFWSWRRLGVAISFIGTELEQIVSESQLDHDRRSASGPTAGRALERKIALMREAARQLRDLKRFVWDSIDSLPDPVLVANVTGQIRLANQPALSYFGATAEGPLEGQTLRGILGSLAFSRHVGAEREPASASAPQWPAVLDPTRDGHVRIMEKGVEVRDAAGHHFVLRYSRCINARNELIGWIANLTDVTSLHAAQNQRDEMMHLLSHDMRSPQASIVTLIDIERPKVNLPEVRLAYDRVERYARRTLALADSFVQLAAAESRKYALEILDFAYILQLAIDEIWPVAHAKGINVTLDTAPGDYPVRAERSMIARALVNLLNNATKYSPPDTVIECMLAHTGAANEQIECIIRDHGYGISENDKARLFDRFQRLKAPGQPDSEGVGLGLAFVRTVVVRHGGTIHCDSSVGVGTSMTIRLACVRLPEYLREKEGLD
ncbi:CHASE2 domain-containing protein [Paraburkholderia domus]|uniref:histidine kinase n=1 Tax=Paraburkholderia domus TaxID=2793075 RepID=A0A9N8N1G5_9BURK|nr:CHASE2 domain-containing protein [Paraburkholderia domus]MBK5169367.1 CHASE2 domain-containing protein [Burkholderia sp. R-70211]CAE6934981.1 Adaptive-response sensory-kinase SasA [Paraburkholderia domus]